ncbi:MAG: hypothetical protein WCE24_03400 [Pseudolabrys sp.]
MGHVGGGIAWPAVARAQQQTVPTIGFLSSRSLEDSKPHLEGFLRGLAAFGFADGKTAKIEYRWANGQYDQLRKLAEELVALHPATIAAAGGHLPLERQSPSRHPFPSFSSRAIP